MARFEPLHAWDVDPGEAVALQNALRERVRTEPLAASVRTIAGADVSYDRDAPTLFAAVLVLALPGLELVESAWAEAPASMPYIPGLLSFREIPALLAAWAKLRTEPDAVMLDGQGIAHPRRMGIASHFGLFVGRPSLGCAKSLLAGTHGPVGEARGARAPLVHRREVVGAALRTRDRVGPVFVSPGHLLDLEGAVALALASSTGRHRIPEPTRRAHLLVNAARRGELAA